MDLSSTQQSLSISNLDATICPRKKLKTCQNTTTRQGFYIVSIGTWEAPIGTPIVPIGTSS